MLLYLLDIEDSRDDGVMQGMFIRRSLEEALSCLDSEERLSPASLLRQVVEQGRKGQDPQAEYPSLFIGVFEMHLMDGSELHYSGEMRYTSVNFKTPPLLFFDGEVVALEMDQTLPSMSINSLSPRPSYREHSHSIAPGSTFLFSTDGLVKEFAGYEVYKRKFQEAAFRHSHYPPEIIAQSLSQGIDDSHLRDDIALLVVEAPKLEKRLCFKVESEFSLVQNVKDRITSFLAPHCAIKSNLLDFHELLVNAMEHGNKRDGGKRVLIDVALTERYYRITITDQGDGFNWRKRINKKDLDLEGESERGRGIILTRLMADYIGYNEQGNRVTIINLY